MHRDYEEKEYQQWLADSGSSESDPLGEGLSPTSIAKRRIRVEFNAHGPMANDMRALIVSLFEEMKIYLKHDGGKRSLTRIYFLFDRIIKVRFSQPSYSGGSSLLNATETRSAPSAESTTNQPYVEASPIYQVVWKIRFMRA